MEGLHNLKDRICDFENLMEAYREAAKGKRERTEVIAFELNLGANLNRIREELLNMTYTVGHYREFYVRYPKPRLVMALGFRDRVVQWAIYRQINPYLDKRYIQHSYGCRKDKGTLAAAECLHNWQMLISRKPDAGDWYLVKGDISKYFYRVDHGKIQDSYRTVSDEAWFGWLIGTIINNPEVPFGLPEGMRPDDCPRKSRLYDVGMPIGNLTSQETANLFLDRLDQYCKHELKQHYYVRYMDDFCIFVKSKSEARRLFREIETFLREELLLAISPKSKIQKACETVEFVGYLITPHGIRMRKKTTAHVKRSLQYLLAAYEAGDVDYRKAAEAGACYLGMCKHCKGHNMARWIRVHYILSLDKTAMEEMRNKAKGMRFYSVQDNGDGTADVYLRSGAEDKALFVVRGVVRWDGMEEEIRRNFEGWCESAEIIKL